MPHDHMYTIAHQLCGGVGGHFGFALVILGDDFDLFPEYAAVGVPLFHHKLGGQKTGQAVGGQLAGVCPGYANFDGIRRHGRAASQPHAQAQCAQSNKNPFHIHALPHNDAPPRCGAF